MPSMARPRARRLRGVEDGGLGQHPGLVGEDADGDDVAVGQLVHQLPRGQAGVLDLGARHRPRGVDHQGHVRRRAHPRRRRGHVDPDAEHGVVRPRHQEVALPGGADPRPLARGLIGRLDGQIGVAQRRRLARSGPLGRGERGQRGGDQDGRRRARGHRRRHDESSEQAFHDGLLPAGAGSRVRVPSTAHPAEGSTPPKKSSGGGGRGAPRPGRPPASASAPGSPAQSWHL